MAPSLRRSPPGRILTAARAMAGGNAVFAVILGAGVLLRVVAMIGYRPALWFNDSYDYVRIGNAPFPHPLRSEGYGIALWLLRPFHSLGLVVALQHLMIVAVAVFAYRALVRDFGVRKRWAAAATAPLLLDGNQIELEHLLLSDTLFTALIVVAVLLLARPGAAGWRQAAVVGGLLGAATLTRTVGGPLIVLAMLFLLVRRARWVSVAVLALAFAVPVGGYAVWFHAEHGRYSLTQADGVFLWGRTSAFADCSKRMPSGDLVYMCPPKPPEERGSSSNQIWVEGSPTGWRNGYAFTPEMNDRAGRFAMWAIREQPVDYVKAVAYDFFVRTFSWYRSGYPTPGTAAKYKFPKRAERMKDLPVIGGGSRFSVVREYEHGSGRTRIVRPFSDVVRVYQEVVNVRGTMLGLVLVFGAAGLVRGRRRGRPGRRGRPESGLFWLSGVALLAVPPVTADFDYRYVLPAMPFAFLAAATAWGRGRPGEDEAAAVPGAAEREAEPAAT
ncbi:MULTISPECIES: hypothetical protein [Actinomadura]|uniref:Phospholipid carrier-dependent glycosyltransferase n=2 Tax=Actinomadura yumaensis TaxID=111807 RepID=A0ABW2C9T7_9ACTN|nr:hypothetical protein [Actinomadura sp. J1-007]MWK33861.1 hypothetical protein [Actinomadura sp. J1-007]